MRPGLGFAGIQIAFVFGYACSGPESDVNASFQALDPRTPPDAYVAVLNYIQDAQAPEVDPPIDRVRVASKGLGGRFEFPCRDSSGECLRTVQAALTKDLVEVIVTSGYEVYDFPMRFDHDAMHVNIERASRLANDTYEITTSVHYSIGPALAEEWWTYRVTCRAGTCGVIEATLVGTPDVGFSQLPDTTESKRWKAYRRGGQL